MSDLTGQTTALHAHILHSADYYQVYERYAPDETLLEKITATGISAQVRIYYTPACGECARHLPALARIAEYLPGWTWQLIEDNEAQLKAAGCSLSMPVITVTLPDGRLAGSINGTPLRGSLEADLWHIVTQKG